MSIKKFSEMTEKDLKVGLKGGLYLLEVIEAAGGEWDDGTPRVDIKTRVAEGEERGKFGPRQTFSIGEASGVTSDGREWMITFEDSCNNFNKAIYAILDCEVPDLTNEDAYDRVMVDEVAAQLTGHRFIANVFENDDGYDRMGRVISAESRPPKAYRVEDTRVLTI